MTAVNCPMCELRFATRTERDWHLRNEHQHVHVHGPTNRPAAWTGHPAPGSGSAPDPARDQEPEAAEDEPR